MTTKTLSTMFAAVTLALAALGLGGCAAEVDPQPQEPTAGDENKPTVELEQSVETQYNSGYSSNCYCLSCTVYCGVNGKTEKAGTCC